ncbi:MAG: EAL domain-containing protein [Mediterraneibacter faecis]
MKELKQAGLQLALDDFGTGYSNFHYLSELHPDIVKIDRGFTSKAITDKKEYYLLNQFSNMIHNLGLKLCIEGIGDRRRITEDETSETGLLPGILLGTAVSL